MNKIENFVEVLKEVLNHLAEEKTANEHDAFVDAVSEVLQFNCGPGCEEDCECDEIGVEDFETEELFDEVYRRKGYEGILVLLDKTQKVHRFGENWKDKG